MFAFDVEVYPNFFSAIFSHVDNDFEDYSFIIYKDKDDRESLREFIRGKTLIGYNNLHFDNLIINAILYGYTLHQIYKLAQKVVNQERYSIPDDEIKKFKYYPMEYKSIDLMKIMAFDEKGVSLKHAGIQLQWPKIQELPYRFDTHLTDSQISVVLRYNSNDVGITKKLYHTIIDEVHLRKNISSLYGVDVSSASRSTTGSRILDKAYRDKSGNDKFTRLRTERKSVNLKNCIGKNISFKSRELKALLELVENTVIYAGDDFNTIVNYAGMNIKFAKGGLHSDDKGGIFESNQEWMIADSDVASFYPMIILNNDLCPEHLNKQYFLSIFRQIVEERLEAKRTNDKIKAEALKITVNAIFGKLKSIHYWLYDPQTFYSVTISGQLYLMSLIERLHLSGFDVISANTDGVVTRLRRSRYNEYLTICQKWMKDTNFELEFSEYQRYIRRDVNNYITIKPDGKMKRKGIFNKIEIDKGYTTPIIRECVEANILENKPIKDVLYASKNIYDFMMSEKIGRQFNLVCQNGHTEEVQKTSRWIATIDGGELKKVNEDGKAIGLCLASPVTIVNDEIPFEQLKINYAYYEKEINSIIEAIKPSVIKERLF